MLTKLLAIRTTLRYHGMEEFLYDWEEFRNSITHCESPLAKEESKKSITGKWRLPEYSYYIAGGVMALAAILYLLLK